MFAGRATFDAKHLVELEHSLATACPAFRRVVEQRLAKVKHALLVARRRVSVRRIAALMQTLAADGDHGVRIVGLLGELWQVVARRIEILSRRRTRRRRLLLLLFFRLFGGRTQRMSVLLDAARRYRRCANLTKANDGDNCDVKIGREFNFRTKEEQITIISK